MMDNLSDEIEYVSNFIKTSCIKSVYFKVNKLNNNTLEHFKKLGYCVSIAHFRTSHRSNETTKRILISWFNVPKRLIHENKSNIFHDYTVEDFYQFGDVDNFKSFNIVEGSFWDGDSLNNLSDNDYFNLFSFLKTNSRLIETKKILLRDLKHRFIKFSEDDIDKLTRSELLKFYNTPSLQHS